MMKTFKLVGSFLALLGVVLISSCSDDPAPIGGGGSVPVADGFYIAKVGEIPTAADGLKSEVVEADGFGTQAREGFFANYVFLTAGNYNVVNVIDQEISQTLGGVSAVVDSTGSDCGLNQYLLVDEYATDGAAFAIATDGLYKVGMDIDTKEIWALKIVKAHVIGGATSFGWSQNDLGEMALQGAATADGVTFKITNVVMKKGDYKLRFDCRWSLNRRTAKSGFDPLKGYNPFTNFGGTTTELAPGGSNLSIPFGQDGKYTLELKWTPADGFKYTTTNTEPVAPKAVNDYAWSIIGDATPNGWSDPDTDLPLLAGSTSTAATYEIASVAIVAGKDFKFRANDAWGIVLKPGVDILGTENGASVGFTSTGGGDPNWKVGADAGGNYKITIATTNGGEKWNITFTKL